MMNEPNYEEKAQETLTKLITQLEGKLAEANAKDEALQRELTKIQSDLASCHARAITLEADVRRGKEREKVLEDIIAKRQGREIIAPGTNVKLAAEVHGVIDIAHLSYGDSITYTAHWWNGKERHSAIFQAEEVAEDPMPLTRRPFVETQP